MEIGDQAVSGDADYFRLKKIPTRLGYSFAAHGLQPTDKRIVMVRRAVEEAHLKKLAGLLELTDAPLILGRVTSLLVAEV